MRLIFCPQASKTEQHQNKNSLNFGRSLTRITQLTSLSLILIGFSFLRQQTVQAETARIDNITIDRQPDETYDSLIQRAELAATSALSQGFSQGSQVTDVSVVILGQNQGVIAPVLAIGLSRPQWSDGNDRFTYFNSARSLLRLEEPQLATADSPQGTGSTPPPPPTPQQNNPPGSAREVINNAPIEPVNPETAPLPGSPALVPRPQAPGIPPVTSPGDNIAPTPTPVAPITTPAPQNLPQVDPANPAPNQP
ncbi:hypothetical protein [Synechocystis sp. PCC 7509]|uniref:hypothetical protein n=1 Tax=Synechocystis sp. PCC 7509 TaxID=927677 RepID=UPI0002AC46BD|nr:hypothetical protein [Synechocystis sp. PCC 7509]